MGHRLSAVMILCCCACGRVGYGPLDSGPAVDSGLADVGALDSSSTDSSRDASAVDAGDGGATAFCSRSGTRAGDFDEDFALAGVAHVTALPGQVHLAKDVHLLPSGEILVLGQLATGTSNAWTVTRLDPDGAVDPTFGTGGHAIIDVDTSNDVSRAMDVDGSGRIVLAGRSTDPTGANERFAVARLLTDGSLDAAFARMGLFVLDTAPAGDTEELTGVAVDAAGEIIAAGYRGRPPNATEAVALRLTGAGALDPAFGTGGIITSGTGTTSDTFEAVLPRADGALLVGMLYVAPARRHASRAIDAGGTPVASYGTGGTALSMASAAYRVWGGDLGSDGAVTTAGWLVAGSTDDLSLGRFLANGVADPGFGVGGVVDSTVGTGSSRAFDVVSDDRGGLFVAADLSEGDDDDVAVLRYTTDGALDPSFQVGGVLRRSFSVADTAGTDESLRAIALDATGRIVTVGWSLSGPASTMLVLRLCGRDVP